MLLIAGAFGQVLRDRWIFSALLMDIPILPIGAVALALDLIRRGRALKTIPFGLGVLALCCVGWSVYQMLSLSRPQASSVPPTISLLQWNVQWGGHGESGWKNEIETIANRGPNIVLLSEAPPAFKLAELSDRLNFATPEVFESDRSSSYWYRLAVLSQWTVRIEGKYTLEHGAALAAVVDIDGRDLRILLVDGISNPLISRPDFLTEISKIQAASKMLGQPFDIIAGDFNTQARSIGFDGLRSARFELASDVSGSWRATFPSYLPIYDIDHVWVGPRYRISQASLFTSLSSDHRGQRVLVHPAGAFAPPAEEK